VTSDYDVAIVGARVAGSITATLLGEAGLRVLLVDSARFPSDTISTHFFRGAGLVAMLQRIGVLEEVLALGTPPLVRQYDYAEGSAEPALAGPQDPGEIGYALSCRRLGLDAILLERARRTSGVEVRLGTPVRDVTRDRAGRVRGLQLQQDGETTGISARLVVGADGRGSLVARLVGAAVERTEQASRAMYFQYVSGFAPPRGAVDGPEFSIIGDELVYAFPSDGEVACVAVSINLAAFEGFRADPAARFAQRVGAHPGIAPRFAGARPESRVLGTGPKDAIVRTPCGPGWALVGDAGLHMDPWTGLGMDNAAKTAGLLSDAVIAALVDGADEPEAFEAYRRVRNEWLMPGFEFTAAGGRDFAAIAW
jgi:flavin-dependent dehydrogenase